MTITLNGDPYAADGPLTIATLLARLDIDPRRVAVERNFTIVRRDKYASTEVTDGDQIEIVNFVGGGSGSIAAAQNTARIAAAQKTYRRSGDQEE